MTHTLKGYLIKWVIFKIENAIWQQYEIFLTFSTIVGYLKISWIRRVTFIFSSDIWSNEWNSKWPIQYTLLNFNNFVHRWLKNIPDFSRFQSKKIINIKNTIFSHFFIQKPLFLIENSPFWTQILLEHNRKYQKHWLCSIDSSVTITEFMFKNRLKNQRSSSLMG